MITATPRTDEFMDEKQLQALATELTKNLKTPAALNQLSRFLKKLTVETALNGELTAPPSGRIVDTPY